MNDMAIINQYLMDASSDSIQALENELIDYPQLDIPVKNGNVCGMYTREITIPKDSLITGRVHLFDYVDIMLSGDITVATEEGPKRYTGANVFHGKAGRKRAGYAHEETKWITVHNWDSDSGDDYYNKMTFVDVGQYQSVGNDRKDYVSLLSELHMTEQQVRVQVDNLTDMCHLPEEFKTNVYVSGSFIEGKGLISGRDFNAGDVICPAGIQGKRTIGGRFSNHSVNPNAVMEPDGDNINLVALINIPKGYEITTNYRDTLSMRGEICLL